MDLSSATQDTLRALAAGAFLKSHRYLEGTKVFRLHPLAGEPVTVARSIVDTLVERRLITSNQKFPAATYLLTEAGRALAATLNAAE